MSASLPGALAILLLAACTLRPLDSTDSATTTTTTSTTNPLPEDPATSDTPTPSSSGATTTSPTTTSPTSPGDTSTGDTTHNFITPPDGGPIDKQCDQWAEDCPEGQKCMPYSGDGDNTWESLKCVDIARDPAAPGEPCTAIGSGVSGEDTCEKHAMCWDLDPDTLTGTCIPMCTGSPDAPGCAEPDRSCTIHSDGVLTLCFPQCDPIAQDCPNTERCSPNWSDSNGFICILDFIGEVGQPHDPCEYESACDLGLLCTNPALALECDQQALGCCLPFCDTDAPNACPGQDQECIPWYDDPQAAATFNQDVGLCQLPNP